MMPALARWVPRLRKIAIGMAVALLLFGIVGYFAIPKAVRWGLETVATRELGRTVRVEDVSANPFTLRVTLRGLTVDGAAGDSAPLLTVRELTANASAASLYYRAPVLDALSIDGLTANLVRLEPQRFNFSDIVDRLLAKPKTDDAPARFSLNNIRLGDGTINFDDRPVGRKHVISELALGIPFLSNLPTHVEIDVQPALSARVNGTPLGVKGETRPFAETLESSVDLKLDGLDLRGYLAYLPVRPNFTLPSGALSTDLSIVFRRAAPARGDRPATVAKVLVSGLIEVTNFALAAPAAQPRPLIGWKSLSVMLEEVGLLARRAVVADVTLVAPTVEVARDAAGALNWQQFLQQPLLSPASEGPSAGTATSPASPLAVTLRHASVRNGTVSITDDTAGRFTLQFVNLGAEAGNLTTTSSEHGTVSVKLDVADGGGSLSAEGDVGLAPIAGRLAVRMQDARLRAPARYLAHIVNGTLDGSSDVSAVLEFAAAEPAMNVLLREISIRGKDISLRGPKGSGADFELAGLQLDDGAIDLTGRTIRLGKVALDAPRATVRRLSDGQINWMQVMRAAPAGESAGTTPTSAGAPAPSWKVVVKEVTVERGDLRLEDLAVDPNVRLRASAISGTVHNVVGDGSERAEIALQTRFGSGGTLSVGGGARLKPLESDLRLDARSLDVSAVRPYLAQYLSATLARAELSARGRVTVDKMSDQAPMRLAYKGGARLGNLHLLDARGENDLLKWQVLDLDQIDARLGDAPPNVTVGKVALSDFYARVIVSEQGRLNLVDVFKRGDAPAEPDATGAAAAKPAEPSASAPKTEPSMPVDREMAGNVPQATAESGRSATAVLATKPDPSTPRPVIRIGQMEFTRGNVNFTDNLIKPNYTANMTGLGGNVTTLASDSAEPATMSLAGKIDEDAPVDINGRLNPLAPKLFLDIEGRTKGVDLPRLTPYSVKYAGYPIVKGKLSMEVSYKVENERLTANNHLYLDQLTFGEKVESPTATKLPVLLAVSLLKNSKGEIDINLPISGTLTDPKFSVGSIIIQVIVNLLTKVVTAPFTLLAAAFGGSEELGYIEFAPGASALAADQTKRLDTLAKALNDRPGLKLDIIGRVDPAADTEGVKRAKVDAKLKAAKVKGLVRRGSDAVDPATVTISAEERPALIAAVYSDEEIPGKPRNFIGLAKSIPAPEMETLILANLAVTPEDLRALANQRAAAVRNQLETQGKVSRERLFLVEPKLTPDGIQDKGAKTRVDFSLK
jgi:uncharacterized protein involved in outer membrane biogenesis